MESTKDVNGNKEKVSKDTTVYLYHIKSFPIFKKIFSFVSEKKKLNMIIYNKNYQKKLYINIDNYKKVSGKYIIGERNGEGKEYQANTNKLIFEGYI